MLLLPLLVVMLGLTASTFVLVAIFGLTASTFVLVDMHGLTAFPFVLMGMLGLTASPFVLVAVLGLTASIFVLVARFNLTGQDYTFSIFKLCFINKVRVTNDIIDIEELTVLPEQGPGGSMSQVVGLPNNSYKPITNTAWVRIRLCKLQKRCTRLAATCDNITSCLPMVGGSLRILRLLPPRKLVSMIELKYCYLYLKIFCKEN